MKQINSLLESEFVTIKEQRTISSIKEIKTRYIVLVQTLITDNPDDTEFENIERVYECDCINAALNVFDREYYYNLENMYNKGNSCITICEKDVYNHIVPFINTYTDCDCKEENMEFETVMSYPVIYNFDEFDNQFSLSNVPIFTLKFNFNKY